VLFKIYFLQELEFSLGKIIWEAFLRPLDVSDVGFPAICDGDYDAEIEA